MLTNSQDGSYSARLFEKEDGTAYLSFSDSNRNFAGGIISISDFLKAETVTLNGARQRRQDVDRSKEYALHKLTDTLIEGKSLARYMLKSDYAKRSHKRQNATSYCIIADNTEYQSPIHNLFCIFDFLAMNENTPRGIPKVLYLTPFNESGKYSIYRLKQIAEIKKYIFIPKVY